jgi:tripartite-type tricarboxylate transporter receptor subunit TctC
MKLSSFKLCAALLAAAFAPHGFAQDAASWPSQPVKIIVPFGAGGGTDQLTRLIANGLTTDLKQSFVVDNKPGAATLIGSELAARAPADGYTLLMSGPASMVTNRFTFKKLNYSPEAFEKVALVAYTPNMLVVNPSMPFKTVQEMVASA